MILSIFLYLVYRLLYAIASPIPFQHSLLIWKMFPPLPELSTLSIALFVLMWIVFIQFWISLGWHMIAYKYIYIFIGAVCFFLFVEIILRGLSPFGFFFFGSITLLLMGVTGFGLYMLVKQSQNRKDDTREI